MLAAVGTAPAESLWTEVPIGSSGWSVRVEEPLARVMAPYRKLQAEALRWALFALVLAILASLGLAAGIARPLRRLRGAAEGMRHGELSRRSGVAGADEIGRLGEAFDAMASSLERLDRAKSDFVANVSHELRTPLTSLRLSVENLLGGVVGPLDPRQRAPLERIERDLERLARLVDDLLELARLEAGAGRPRKVDLDLGDLARAAIEAWSENAERKRITLTIEGAGRARADAAMMQRVLANLLDNAIKFAPEGSRVIVRLAPDEFRVADDGPGVGADEQAERVFERFVQGRSDGVKNPGAGLGLAIVKKLVELHGGEVSLSATHPDGTGATFVVRLGESVENTP